MAQVGGISVAEMNKLEIELCLRLNWELHIVHDEYLNMVESLLQPHRPLWRRWQHQHSLSFSSDDEAAPPESAGPSHALGGMQQAARSLLPKWAGGFPRAQGGASDAAQPPADALIRQASDPTSGRGDPGASPATSVSVH